MFKYKNDIYDLCSSTTEKIFEAFCYEINTSDVDVFVIMAHKAVRLFQILYDQKHIADHIATKTIISNHALDFDCSYLLGKKVAIVDDILISGTSIASTVHKLLDIGVLENNISIITLAIDKCYQNMSFVDENGCSLLHCRTLLEDSTCIELSYNISKIFSYYGMSYDVDFPNYRAIKLNEKKINLLFNNLLWETSKISNENKHRGNIDTFILFPNECVRKLLWKRIGVDLEEVTHLKIRTYVNNFPSGKKDCHIVPMCLFNEISESDTDSLYNMFKPRGKEVTLHHDKFISKMRYVQYYIAHQLYLVFNDITSLKNDAKPTKASINLLFGIDSGATILNEINTLNHGNGFSLRIKSLGIVGKETIVKDFFSSKIGKEYLKKANHIKKYVTNNKSFEINHIIFMPFLWWYDTKEIPVRKELADNQYHFIANYADIEIKLKRLNSGFSLKLLEDICRDVLAEYDSEYLISLFIDRAIDEGIIVPTICHAETSNCLYRAYRHGEDLPFGLEDECRLLYYLQCLSELIPNIKYSSQKNNFTEGIATISFEKMIVLFYQMGIEQGDIFNRFLGFDNIKLLKPFLSMHGTVEGFVDPQYIKEHDIEEHFYSESLEGGDRYITWLTSWLNNKFIKKIEIKSQDKHTRTVYAIKYDCVDNYLAKHDRNCISPVIKRNISNIATIIATWYNHMVKTEGKDKFKEDAIALTSCSNSYVYASAISTEIHYFSKFWSNQANNAIENADNVSNLITKFHKTDEYKEQIANTEQALYSGQNKVKLFLEKRASSVIQNVAKILPDNYVDIWTKLLESVESSSIFGTKDLKTYIDQIVGFLYFYSACFACLKSEFFWKYGEKPIQYEEFKKLYMLQYKKSALLNKELFDELDNISKLNDFFEKRDNFSKLVSNAIINSNDAIKNIEHEIEKGASNYTVRYKSSLVFEVNPFDRSKANDKIMNVWKQLEENIDKTQLNIVLFSDELRDLNFMRYGIFYGSSSYKKDVDIIKASEFLADIYKKLCNEFDGKAYEIRAMLIPDTPPGRMFRHNVQRNIAEYTSEFTTNVIKELKDYYVPDTRQQMILATTDYVDSKFYNVVKEMQWDNQKSYRLKASMKIFSKIKVCYNNYVHPNTIDAKDIAYSIIKIICGDVYGTGFMLRMSDKIVCITCNHLLQAIKEHQPQCLSDYNDEVTFSLKPLKDVLIVDYKATLLIAKDEVAILEPQLQGRIPFDMNGILSPEDLYVKIDEYYNSYCICCGYPDGEQCWSDQFHLIGSMAKGYCQTKINDEGNPVKDGYSGGIIVSVNNHNCILGIHEGRKGDVNGRMISCKVILDEIEGMDLYVKS